MFLFFSELDEWDKEEDFDEEMWDYLALSYMLIVSFVVDLSDSNSTSSSSSLFSFNFNYFCVFISSNYS